MIPSHKGHGNQNFGFIGVNLRLNKIFAVKNATS